MSKQKRRTYPKQRILKTGTIVVSKPGKREATISCTRRRDEAGYKLYRLVYWRGDYDVRGERLWTAEELEQCCEIIDE